MLEKLFREEKIEAVAHLAAEAFIDDSLYAATLETAKAQLQQSTANKVSADANVLIGDVTVTRL